MEPVMSRYHVWHRFAVQCSYSEKQCLDFSTELSLAVLLISVVQSVCWDSTICHTLVSSQHPYDDIRDALLGLL